MTPERWRITEDVLVAALDASPDEREALLAERCACDPALLADVRALIEAQQQADSWAPPGVQDGGTGLDIAPEEEPDRRAGPYRLEKLIGRGGMGAVFLAHRADGEFTQKVAIKLIGLPFELEPFRERFRRERQILAGLNHPNITRLLDGGVTPEGELYLAMEYVEGVPLDEYCRQSDLAEADRLHLFQSVCGAVQYAHQNLIVHRDIKPSNILVSPDGVPKLLDFGTAKLLSGEPGFDDATRTGMGLMTAAYASPEQLGGEPASTLSDVYSLGVLLYELLSGQRAFGNDILSRVERHPTPHLPKGLGSDLDRIVSKALEREAARRYPSVEQLSEDVRRYMDGEPVLAHPAGLVYRASKFVRRHAWGVALVTIFIIGLAGATAFSIWQASVAKRQAARAESINAFLNQMLSSPNPSWYNTLRNKGKNVTVLDVINEMQGRIATEFAAQPGVEIELRRTIGRMYSVLGQHPEARTQLQIALNKQLASAGRNHPETAKIYVSLAGENYLTQHFADGIDNAKTALSILKETGRREDRQVLAEAYNALAVSLGRAGGPPAEVESAMRQALSLSRELSGNGGSTPTAVSVLASFETQQGKFDDAARLANESLALQRARPGKPAGESLFPLRDLGAISIERQDYGGAEQYLRESLEIARDNMGPDSPYAIDVRAYLSLAMGLSGHAAEAELELNTCIQAYLAVGGSAPLRIAQAKQFLGRVQMRRDELGLAEVNLRQSLTAYRQYAAANDPRIANAAGYLGECLLAEKKRDEAVPLLTESYQNALTAFGPTHVWTIQAKERLGKVPRKVE